MPATPIFILGRHRSGTTWLGNILASVPEIHAVSHDFHRGVHESAYFSHLVPYCGHGRTDADLRMIKRLFERSDFFALSGLAQGPDIDGLGVPGYFRAVMEEGSRRRGARYWLEKTPANTLHARYLADAFPDAVLIAVVRNHRDVVCSLVHGFDDPGSFRRWFWQSMLTGVYEKIIERNRVAVIRYESLLADYDGTVRAVLKVLGIESDPVPRSPHAPNTSHQAVSPRIEWWQRCAIAMGRGLVWPLPAALVEWAVIRWRIRTPGSLPPWFFARQDAEAGGGNPAA
jgi:hypothetical protein